MAKKDYYLNHSRNLSTNYKINNYAYDAERSKATSKQIKFYQALWYKFKDNGLDINQELDARNMSHDLIQNPSGRAEYSQAIDLMIDILSDHGLYEKKSGSEQFVPSYCSQYRKDGRDRHWQQIRKEDHET